MNKFLFTTTTLAALGSSFVANALPGLPPEAPQDPPVTGGSFGDPHFMTWTGDYYDFHGACDLVLATSAQWKMAAHIRTKRRYDSYSYIESAALQLGEDVLEVGAYGSYMLNGVSNADLSDVQLANQYSVTRVAKNDRDISFVIAISEDEHIVLKAYKDLVSIQFQNMNASDLEDVVGMMGSIQTGTKYARDGAIILEDDTDFGMEWQVRPGTDPELFQTKPSVQYPTPCLLPDPVATKDHRRRLVETTITQEDATVACQKYFSTRAAMEACIYDILATHDLQAANAGVF